MKPKKPFAPSLRDMEYISSSPKFIDQMDYEDSFATPQNGNKTPVRPSVSGNGNRGFQMAPMMSYDNDSWREAFLDDPVQKKG